MSFVSTRYREYGEVQDPFRQYTGQALKLSKADLKFLDTIVWTNFDPSPFQPRLATVKVLVSLPQ